MEGLGSLELGLLGPVGCVAFTAGHVDLTETELNEVSDGVFRWRTLHAFRYEKRRKERDLLQCKTSVDGLFQKRVNFHKPGPEGTKETMNRTVSSQKVYPLLWRQDNGID